MNRSSDGMWRWKSSGMLRWAVILLVLGACDLPQEPEEPENPSPLATSVRWWEIWKLTNDERFNEIIATDEQVRGVVNTTREIGTMVSPPAPDSIARAEVFSNETGKTYWVGAQAPSPWGLTSPDSTVGSAVRLVQGWSFVKNSPDAKFQLVISETFLEVIDHNGIGPTPEQCPWGWSSNPTSIKNRCKHLIQTEIAVSFWAYTHGACCDDLFSANGTLVIQGWGSTFQPIIHTDFAYGRSLFQLTDFEIDPPSIQGRHVTMRLRSPITVDVPLDSVAVGEAFELAASVEAVVWTRRQGESYASAYFRDPVKTAGLSFEYEGLTMLEPPTEIREPAPNVAPAPPCDATSSSGTGGTIQFDTGSYLWPEWPGDEAKITVTRTGGSDGEASVAFTAGGGTASPGSDYEAMTTQLRFADGDEGARTVFLPITADTIAEPHETVSLMLSSPAGCATLGSSSAELTIMDDDQPLPDLSHTIGGTVTGLEGSGLVLTNLSTDHLEITDNGPFVFDREYADGVIYEIRVDTQPSDPAQFCTVSNGEGTVAGADVTNIEVACETLPPADADLDPGFGDGGKVTNPLAGPGADIALQDDGKMVVVGGDGFSGATLSRYNPDGSLDTGFGTGGVVSVEFYGAAYDVLRAVAIQPDGRIVVAGESKDGVNSRTQEDFIVARYHADGTVDTSFGGDGRVVTDFVGRGDGAYDVLIQPDGAIVVVGIATLEVIHRDIGTGSFGVVRYTSTGELDPSFGGDGTVATDVAGLTGDAATSRISFGYAAALQPDGKIVLAGRVGESGGDEPDIGVVRYNPDGSLDSSFAAGGIRRDETEAWDEAADIVVQPDGKVVVVGLTLHEGGVVTPGPDMLTIARYNPDGSIDGGFGAGGRVDEVPGIGRGIALQQDGSLVAAGWVRAPGQPTSNLVIARFSASGQLDTTFGDNGAIEVDFFGGADVAEAIVIQADGKIVAAGSAVNGASTGLGMVRVLP